jgi:hypothetical protein
MIQCFLSPSELFSPWDLYAVGSVGYVMNSMNVSIKEDVLRVILVKKVKIEDALTQLEILGREKPEYNSGFFRTGRNLIVCNSSFLSK